MSAPTTDSPAGWINEHIKAYDATDGAEGHIWNGVPTLLLTTLGRSSGVWRRTALIYGKVDGSRDEPGHSAGGDLVVVASQGGAPDNPQWYKNLLEHTGAKVQVAGDTFEANARDAAGEERTRLWDLMVDIWPAYADYQEKTEREIPIVVLARG